MEFEVVSPFKPAGSQPAAIKELVDGYKNGKNWQTLLGVTGSGKTFTMANVISQVKKPTLVLAHNKTLAAQLYNELKEFFPNNRVEYFVSFYDFYQPESYIPAKDQYIEKDSQVNPMIERMRLSATASVMSRDDVIIVASVSCIYGLGNPANFKGMGFDLEKGQKISRRELLQKLMGVQYERNDLELDSGRFRVKGDTIDIIPGYSQAVIRIEMFGDEIDRITEIDKLDGTVSRKLNYHYLFPARHFVTPSDTIKKAIQSISKELDLQLPKLGMIERHRLKQRTMYDIEMLETIGFCKGIENYSRHFDGRKEGEKPYCLLDYFGRDFFIIIDESHQSIPQLHGMYRGDRMRKENLVEYGFRLPSALDNRPLRFEETEEVMKKQQVLFVSATPAMYEQTESANIVEQIIRPTGLVDPTVEMRPSLAQMEDLKREIGETLKKGNRVFVIALTKKMAEEISDHFSEAGIKTRYMHSEVKTLEREELLRQLRVGTYDVLVGINLLREGIDLPELGLVAILDADKEGFLRDARSLIQLIGRAARNVSARVILYGDDETDSIKAALAETSRRREIQLEYNKKHGITPKTVIKPVSESPITQVRDVKSIPKGDLPKMITQTEKEMKEAADRLDFELAIALREQLIEMRKGLGSKKNE